MNDLPLQSKIVSAAQGLLSGTSDFLETVRSLSALRFEVSADGHDPDFLLFLAIDSETDHLPSPKTTPHCSQEWLAQSEQEKQNVVAFYEADVKAACEQLLKRFAP